MQMRYKFPPAPAHDSLAMELLFWAAVILIVLLNGVMMWRIATATV